MRFVALVVASMLVSTSPASAEEMRYGWCETEAGQVDYHMSDLMQKPKGESSETVERAFQAAIGTDRRINCWFYYSTPSEAKSYFDKRRYVIETEEKKSYSLTRWTGPYAITGAPAEKPAGAYLTVESASGDQSVSPAVAPKPKKSNAQADAEYAAAMNEYHRQIDQQKKEHQAALDAVEQRKAEQRASASQALAAYQDQLRAHDQQVRNQQLEYQKMVAKPADAPNAVYRGFTGPDCDFARRSATQGAGTSSTTRFKEVTTESVGGQCLVQGWWWNVAGGGTATRQ